MHKEESCRFAAWLDEESRIISFHPIPSARCFRAESAEFWEQILTLALAGWRAGGSSDGLRDSPRKAGIARL